MKYRYFNGDNKHPYEFKECLTCKKKQWIQNRSNFCSCRCSKLGELNPSKQKRHNLTLSKVQYVRAHELLRKARGKADKCVNGCLNRKYGWANISGDYFNIEDYQPMCYPCHDFFDRYLH